MRLGRARAVAMLLALAACRGERPAEAQDSTIAAMVDSLRPGVEAAVGLPFREPPRSALRSRDQVRRYLIAKLDEEMPPARARQVETAYRLFGMLPDTVSIRPLLLDLLTEQVVGYYDPDSAMLFGVSGGDPSQMRLVLAHELVHALQGQYVELDSLLQPGRGNDRLTATQAVLEGQATLASIQLLSPDASVLDDPAFWDMYQDQVQSAQSSMPRFAAAPLVVREGLIFPYVQGARFVNWWRRNVGADSMPWSDFPGSTEQIIHPDRYAAGDRPLTVRFSDSVEVVYEDGLGELEMLVLTATALGSDEVPSRTPLGWGGDRYRVVETPAGPALVWYAAFDTPAAADRFAATTGAWLRERAREGYRSELARMTLDGPAVSPAGSAASQADAGVDRQERPAVRWVFAPAEWEGWGSLPTASAD